MPTVYEVITARIVDKLEAGTVPWHKPWSVETGAPRNLIAVDPNVRESPALPGFAWSASPSGAEQADDGSLTASSEGLAGEPWKRRPDFWHTVGTHRRRRTRVAEGSLLVTARHTLLCWRAGRDSNPRPSGSKAGCKKRTTSESKRRKHSAGGRRLTPIHANAAVSPASPLSHASRTSSVICSSLRASSPRWVRGRLHSRRWRATG